MNKKASLKDAFVKSMEGAGNQQARDTAIQAAVYPGSQHSVSPNQPAGYPVDQEAGHTGNQPPVHTATQIAVETSQPPILRSGSLYVQQPSHPPIQVKKKATFNLDAALHQRLKIAAAMHSREMVDIVQDALQAYLPVLDKKVG